MYNLNYIIVYIIVIGRKLLEQILLLSICMNIGRELR